MAASNLEPPQFIGKPAIDLPTPSLVLSLDVLELNIQQMLKDVEEAGILFRPHVKTLKSLEVTRKMMGGGKHSRIIASTMAEIRGVLPLVEEGILTQCVYGLPVYKSVLSSLHEISTKLPIVLMIDNIQHVALLESFNMSNGITKPWDVFIKIDVGSKRAGIGGTVDRLPELVRSVEESPAVNIYGFYCHAGHSYSCRTKEDVAKVLKLEVAGVLGAAKLMAKDTPVVLSIGATPTAHVVADLKTTLPAHMQLELHAGNYPTNDLQQLSTGLITREQQAVRILTEVCSVYPERNEALLNAGVIALARESSAFPGFANVVELPDWNVVRLSQEHGILGVEEGTGLRVEDAFFVGKKVWLYPQHSCITAAQYAVYYVVDGNDIVRDAWIPWKGW